ncbi:glycerophosphodiester phosphodiesterase [Actinocorallia sp. A-T 12471]|uniref:glycerophosphodiester phosphodiesterase n=1 Tax=Actinocorallia sp. A-T 12471 TaxID=3089813 RepID=UPI0029D13D71|nr:glycerophosphodiester phosphodiesterase family protein [Actinocorallia sp. A-T 12471]MDX6742998.1 glycerophosphodiester phosphodiesterase family protein [Actinocorallia sp. A-T 12471]
MPRLGVVLAAAVSVPLALPAVPAAAAPAEPVEKARSGDVTVIAHRGASAYAPENTVAAIREAGRRGADMIEIDVRQTKDGKVVVMHDATLTRTTDARRKFPKRKSWKVRDLTLAQIRKLDAGSWYGRAFKGQKVPTLAEALKAVKAAGDGVVIELKQPELYPGMTAKVVAALKADPYWLKDGRALVQSFTWSAVRDVNDRVPQAIRTGVLGRPNFAEMLRARFYADVLHIPRGSAGAAYVAQAHNAMYRVYAYTANDAATARRLMDSGVDGITTDRPDVLRALLDA